ncbi:MAG: ribonucleotide-diphosphate reductase subunit beta [Solirubrobacterales bacterium]|nr:ribonucleotide-diphosphate reductase subunit beta [Solirubrobacterales bacterium]
MTTPQPSTIETREAIAADQLSYEDLYARWEKGNWSSTDIDFSQDKIDWKQTFTPLERKAALWNYALFFHGEDSVTDNLSPFIDAAPLEEQKYFLATQQADEARHAVFFGRFMKEVVETGAQTIAGSLNATRPELTWGFLKTFEALDRVADELRRDQSPPMLARAITLYHLIIEATLAQPGQHFIESYLVERSLLPGFRSGMRNVALDEQRHIGFGVKMIADLIRIDPECKAAISQMLREVTPYTVAVFVPPNWDERYATSFGFCLEDIFEEGARSLEAKLRAAGLPPEELPGGSVFPFDLPARERGDRALALLRSNYLGERFGPVSRDPEIQALYFDGIKRAVDPSAPEMTVIWEFTDAEPWHLRVANGSTAIAPGRIENADLTLRCTLDDFVDITAKREDPRRAILRGKLRLKGSPVAIWRARALFAA